MIDILSFLAMTLSLLGNVLLIKKNKLVFPLWIIANLLWIVINVFTMFNLCQVIMFTVYVILAIIGWYNWKKS